jgi:dipeptidyl aminopeptidase/acylaminoacyl peptidase
VGLWVQPLDGAARRIDLGEVVIAGSFGYDVTVGKDGSIALVGSTPGRPSELYYLASPTSPVRRLTSFNDATAALALGRMERITWTSDGLQADGVVVYPADFSADKVYPLVLVIHGGPTAASKTSFSVLPQLMAAEGWIVFSPNYRGSDNLGNTFQTAIVGDAGKGPGRDVMAGVAELRKRKYVDPKRTAVTGWSYGGFMTTWLIGNYPGEWQAAMAGAPVTDLEDQYHFADFNVQARYAVDGRSPWVGDARAKYVEQSPVTYVGKVRTPTLVMSNVEDFRVPPTQAYRYWRALKDQGVETKFVAIPGRTHFPGDPVRSRDVYRRWVEWVRQHIGRGVS